MVIELKKCWLDLSTLPLADLPSIPDIINSLREVNLWKNLPPGFPGCL